MDKIVIKGGFPINGEVYISGSKNSVLPLMCCSLLTDEKLTIGNIPNLVDIKTMNNLLCNHGCKLTVDSIGSNFFSGKKIIFDASDITNLTAPYDIVVKMRASVLVLGPLLARFGFAKVSLPGGCAIGTRPVDLHIDALEKLGADIKIVSGYIIATAKDGLVGGNIHFKKISVGATENIIMAATLAQGKTVITNAAVEPEIIDLCKCLVKMGAKISGIGNSTIEIEGVTKLHSAVYEVMPDRIEAFTYIIAAAITHGKILLKNFSLDLIQNVKHVLDEIGITLEKKEDGILAYLSSKTINPINVETREFPGFSTDMQAQLMTLLSLGNGTSEITENIFENRFMHVAELKRMGANIEIDHNKAIIKGVEKFNSAVVMATDLRASVSLVLAALATDGVTEINRVYHMDRGYEFLVEKLSFCGANIKRVI